MSSPDQEKTGDNSDTLDAEYKLVQPSQEDVPGMATYQSLARLLVGATILGGDELLRRVRAWEDQQSQDDTKTPSTEDETATDQLRYALVGLLFEAPETAARGVIRTAAIADSVVQSGDRVLGPVLRSRLFGPVRRRGQKMQERVKTSVDRWVEVGRAEEVVGQDMAQALTPQLIDDIVAVFADNEAIQNLIRVQAGEYLNYLDNQPKALDPLVQQVGDQYIRYLREDNPEDVQALIAGQTMTMTTEVANEVRERTVTGDSVIEMFVRSLLRRTPRQELPGPPPEVQQRLDVQRQQEKLRRDEARKNDE
jgi:hypothetical protein